ncbi:MAG: hypothetical protein ACN6NJ_08230 [Acinetobacter sp.]
MAISRLIIINDPEEDVCMMQCQYKGDRTKNKDLKILISIDDEPFNAIKEQKNQ